MEKIKLFILGVFVTASSTVFASNIFSGTIYYETTDTTGLSFKFTVTIYRACTDTLTVDSVELNYGFGLSKMAQLTSSSIFASDICMDVYSTVCTYSPTYIDSVCLISATTSTWPLDVLNMESDLMPFYIEATLKIGVQNNHSPIEIVHPNLIAYINQDYINSGYEDEEGDSLYIESIAPFADSANEIPLYVFPNDYPQISTTTFLTDSTTGTITWSYPYVPGIYGIATKVSEYRNSLFLGSIVKQQIIYVSTTSNSESLLISHITLHPNPATSTITLSGTEQGSTATITNIHGQVLLQSEIRSPQSDINIAHLPAGFYFCTLQNGYRRQVLRFVRE